MTSVTLDLDQEAPIRKIGGKIEDFIVSIIFLGPMIGVFNPWEDFSNPREFDIATATTNTDFPVTAQISHATFFFVGVLILRYWRNFLAYAPYAVQVIALYLVFVASAFWSEEPATTIRLCYHFFEILLLSLYLCFRFDSVGRIMFFNRLFIAQAVLSLVCVIFFPQYGLTTNLGGYLNAWRGAFASKNALGCVAGLGVIFLSISFISMKERRRLIAFGLLLNLILLIMSRSMTSTLTTMLCCLILGFIYARQTLLGWVAVGIAGITGVTSVLAVLAASDSVTGAIGRSSTLTGRTDVWRVTIEYISQRPVFGYGLGFWSFLSRSKANVWAELGWAAPHAHEDYLDVTLQVGLIGTILVILNYLFGFYHGVSMIKRHNVEAVVLFLILVYFFVRGFTETISVFPGTNLSIFVILAQMQLRRLFSTRTRPGNISYNS